jgi:hypothetical protein
MADPEPYFAVVFAALNWRECDTSQSADRGVNCGCLDRLADAVDELFDTRKETAMPHDPMRRADVTRFTPAEKAIYEAMIAVEAVGADVRLTRAVIALQTARNHVADYVDGINDETEARR